jgi:SAM-dependent methyltransferase
MSMREEWWKSFFQGAFLDFWTACVPESQTQQEADFLEQELQVPPGGKVLDVPCGNGRLSLALAQRGLCLTGIDIAAEYIEGARARSAERQLAVEWQQENLLDMTWEGVFDAAFCFGNSFGYFDDAGNADFFRVIGRALKPGGRFVLDSGVAAESIFPHFTERFWAEVGGIHFLAQRAYDPVGGILRSNYTLIRDGVIDQRSAFYRVYRVREILALAEQAGFGDLVLYSTLERESFRLGSPRLLLSVRKL